MPTIIDGTAGITFPNSTIQASAGQVLQVVNTTFGNQSFTNSATFVDSGLTATITPKFASSKILAIVNMTGLGTVNSSTTVVLGLTRNSTSLLTFEAEAGFSGSVTTELAVGGSGTNYLDSPATTSATTYKVQVKRGSLANFVYWCLSSSVSSITLMEIAQ